MKSVQGVGVIHFVDLSFGNLRRFNVVWDVLWEK